MRKMNSWYELISENNPLPCLADRIEILNELLKDHIAAQNLTEEDYQTIAMETKGLSKCEIAEVCRHAAFLCLRSISDNEDTNKDNTLRLRHFVEAVQTSSLRKLRN
uniref:AAA ATPase AAA+ lid domain-containing protein n=1 Tax=Trichobilharzia regenti TaxID=157069 RepID=A0AA85J0E4_TRIRE|nr:unnamed protein product [Trichobilharzia regenti]